MTAYAAGTVREVPVVEQIGDPEPISSAAPSRQGCSSQGVLHLQAPSHSPGRSTGVIGLKLWVSGPVRRIIRRDRAVAATFLNMLTDGRDVPAKTVFVVDLCIIGTGPAGLANSDELSGSRHKILLIERGALTGPPAADLNSGLEFESPHFRFPLGTLRKGFGGMAPTLGNHCPPTDLSVHATCPWIPSTSKPDTGFHTADGRSRLMKWSRITTVPAGCAASNPSTFTVRCRRPAQYRCQVPQGSW